MRIPLRVIPVWILLVILTACSMPPDTAPAFTPTRGNIPATVVPGESSTPQPPQIDVRESLECLSGPGEGYDKVLTVEPGMKLDLVGRDSSGDYWIVLDAGSGKECWILNSHTDVQGSTDGLPIVDPPPSEAGRPNAPENFQVQYLCTKLKKDHYDLSLVISWEDASDNETGFEIYKNMELYKTLEADATEYRETTVLYYTQTEDVVYSIRAFNDIGRSKVVMVGVLVPCK